MRRVKGLGVAAEVRENPLDDRRPLDAAARLTQPLTAAVAFPASAGERGAFRQLETAGRRMQGAMSRLAVVGISYRGRDSARRDAVNHRVTG